MLIISCNINLIKFQKNPLNAPNIDNKATNPINLNSNKICPTEPEIMHFIN